jgi:hypothetical protein
MSRLDPAWIPAQVRRDLGASFGRHLGQPTPCDRQPRHTAGQLECDDKEKEQSWDAERHRGHGPASQPELKERGRDGGTETGDLVAGAIAAIPETDGDRRGRAGV